MGEVFGRMSEGDKSKVGGTGAATEVVGKVVEFGKVFVKSARPWNEVFDKTSFSKPANLPEATSRIRKNIHYFKINYAPVVTATLLVAMLMYPKALIILSVLAFVWMYIFVIKTSALVISGRTFSDREKLFGMSGLTLLVVFFLTDIGGIILYALCFAVVAICVHGSLRVPDDLFIDEAEMSGGGGFFSIPAAARAAAVATAV